MINYAAMTYVTMVTSLWLICTLLNCCVYVAMVTQTEVVPAVTSSARPLLGASRWTRDVMEFIIAMTALMNTSAVSQKCLLVSAVDRWGSCGGWLSHSH